MSFGTHPDEHFAPIDDDSHWHIGSIWWIRDAT